MSTELHLNISADSAVEALAELAAIGRRAAVELGVAPQSPDTPAPAPAPAPDKGNGEDAAAPAAGKKAGRSKKAEAAPPADAGPDRADIIKGLTDLYMAGNPVVRDRITAFRDTHGAQRLRELKDAALPEAAKLLGELQQLEAAAP
jgi:hypothetical protein